MEKYINSQHRYYTLNYYLKERFNSKVFKVALNGNFTCPNRDGTISTKGCIFCSPSGSGDFAGNKSDTLEKQFSIVSEMIHKKWKKAKYIVYFQANTNTYKPLNELKDLFEKAITLSKDIVAISIATRPDCLSKDILDYLNDLNKRIPVWVELGLQTINEVTAITINRGYKLETFEKAVNELQKRKIETIVHIINGLPGENELDMYNNIHYLNKLNIQGIKIHSLFILKGTPLGNMYEDKPFPILSKEKYVEIVSNQLGLLNKDIVVHRINGDAPRDLLIAPLWSIKKLTVMNDIDKYMKDFDIYQGSLQLKK